MALNLLYLDDSLLLEIFSHSDIIGLTSLQQTCQRFNSLIKEFQTSLLKSISSQYSSVILTRLPKEFFYFVRYRQSGKSILTKPRINTFGYYLQIHKLQTSVYGIYTEIIDLIPPESIKENNITKDRFTEAYTYYYQMYSILGYWKDIQKDFDNFGINYTYSNDIKIVQQVILKTIMRSIHAICAKYPEYQVFTPEKINLVIRRVNTHVPATAVICSHPANIYKLLRDGPSDRNMGTAIKNWCQVMDMALKVHMYQDEFWGQGSMDVLSCLQNTVTEFDRYKLYCLRDWDANEITRNPPEEVDEWHNGEKWY